MNKRDVKTHTATSQTARAQTMDKAQEYLAGWKRAQADYDNLRKRTEEQRAQVMSAAIQEVIREVLPVLDNLDQVLVHAAAAKNQNKDLYVGAQMVAKQLRGVLAAHGVSEVEALGKPFDPALHEAIASVPGKKDVCVAEHARGYKLGESVLRPSRVSVGNGVQPAAPAKGK